MELNWTTFALEIINFLALLWILKRFLYRPVMQTLAERRAGIERTLAEARATEAQASAMQQQFESRLADWEQEKAAARRRFETELDAERARQMEALTKDLATERERSAAQDAHRLDTQRRELAVQASTEARQFASALFARLAGPELEGQLVQLFIEELAALPEDRLSNVRAGQNGHGQGILTSAFALTAAQRQQLSNAIDTRLGKAIALEFVVDPNLLAGARLALGAWQLDFSLAGELGIFAEASTLGR
jgi:F-type H+-transporting ATPase subunit b